MKLKLFILAMFFLFTPLSWAGTYNVMTTWTIEPLPTDLAGFNLRINSNEIIDIPDANIRAWSGMLTLNDGNNTFELQSIDLAGQASEWSDPAYFDPPPNKPVLTIIILK